MSDFFRKFPLVTYNNVRVRDMTRRVAIIKNTLNDPLLNLPYTIREGEKPEDVAFGYYGSVDFTWLVLLSNGMMDPYTDWPMDTDLFHRYFIDKYTEVSGETDWDVIAWGQNQEINENLVFYYKEDDYGKIIQIGPESYGAVLDAQQAGWQPMRIYDYEHDLNEAKRNIQLVDTVYKDRIDGEFRKLIVK